MKEFIKNIFHAVLQLILLGVGALFLLCLLLTVLMQGGWEAIVIELGVLAVVGVLLNWSYHSSTLPTTPKKEMTGLEYEHFCAKYLIQKGFKSVRVTPGSNDFGGDIIATDKHGDTWVFQCKKYSGKVSNTAVQEAVAAKAHYGAKKAAVITNSELTKKARQLAFENAVMLYESIE